MASMPIIVETTKVRLRKSSSGNTGSSMRRSTKGSRPHATTVMTPRPMICHDNQSYWEPPQVASSTIATAPASMRVSPSQSILAASSCLGSLRAKRQAIQATTPSGRLIQNTQRQEIESVSQPPRSGPSTEETPNIAPIGAM